MVSANHANSSDPNWKDSKGLQIKIVDREVNKDDGKVHIED